MAQGLPPFDAASCGVYLHAIAGELVKAELGDTGMIAGDLLPRLPLVIRSVKHSIKRNPLSIEPLAKSSKEADFLHDGQM